MKNLIMNLTKIDRRHVRIILAVVYMGLLILGAGAPGVGGDVGF